MYSCHKLLKKSLRWIAIEMNEGIALSLLLGLMWNLMQFEKTCHTSNWIARVFMYSRRRMARQTCPKSMGFVTIFEYNVTSYFKVVSGEVVSCSSELFPRQERNGGQYNCTHTSGCSNDTGRLNSDRNGTLQNSVMSAFAFSY